MEKEIERELLKVIFRQLISKNKQIRELFAKLALQKACSDGK